MNQLNKLMKQAQQMQNRLGKAQEEIAAKDFEGQAGGGVVKVVAKGHGNIVSIKIAPEILKEGDAEMLEDLILTAVNEAIEKGKALQKAEMSKLTGGMNIPGF
ncbi:nucleoid-associated protein [Verrucomicrobia bacterium LW23]|nr:nucleoid-associated protein [Verrucomicrobia bacterium LW23]